MDDSYETERFSAGLNPIRTISQNKWLKDQLFKKKEDVASYSNDKLAIGRKRDGSVVYIDIKESIRVVAIAPNRCLEENTYIKTIVGEKRIKDLTNKDLVLSYNFKTEKEEYKQIITYPMKRKQCYRLILGHGQGMRSVVCSKHHNFFIKGRFNSIEIKKFSELKLRDWVKTREGFSIVTSLEYVGLKNTYDITVKDNHNYFLHKGILVKNSGKTWLFRSAIDRLRKSDKLCVYLTDFKDELKSSSEPLQSKFHNLLLKGEKPEGFETMTLRPTFFKSVNECDKLAKDNTWYSVRLNEVTQGDFKLLVNYYELHPNQQITIDIIWEQLKKEEFKSWEQIDAIIDSMDDINDASAMSIKRKFKPLKLSQFYEEEHCHDIIPAIEQGVVFGINFENFEAFGRENTGLVQAFNAMILRKIIMARRAKRLSKQVHIFIDEFTRVVPIDKDTATKIEVQQSVQLDARYGINYWLAVQDLNLFPEDIWTQCRYTLLPYNASVPTIQKVLMHTALTRYVQRSYQDAVGLQQQLRKHDWLLVDRVNKTHTIFSPLAPLSCHAETTK